MDFKVTGMYYRPLAEILWDLLPDQAPIVLQDDPNNPHDPNATKVLLPWSTLDRLGEIDVDFALSCANSEYTFAELKSKCPVHLGYVARDQTHLFRDRVRKNPIMIRISKSAGAA